MEALVEGGGICRILFAIKTHDDRSMMENASKMRDYAGGPEAGRAPAATYFRHCAAQFEPAAIVGVVGYRTVHRSTTRRPCCGTNKCYVDSSLHLKLGGNMHGQERSNGQTASGAGRGGTIK